MGLLESITHKEESRDLIVSAEKLYNSTLKRFENQKADTTKKLENLGKLKIEIWSSSMTTFVSAFEMFKNVSMENRKEMNMKFIGSDVEPQQMLTNIHDISMTAGEVAKAGIAAVGTGALVGIASYGGVMMFGVTSAGTAIASLSDAAKSDATLEWFGGGSIEDGGLGKVGGTLVLAGIVLAPILIVGSILASSKGFERLANAKRIFAEAKAASENLDIVTTGMIGISKMSINFSVFIKDFEKKFKPFTDALIRISKKYPTEEDGKIDFSKLSNSEQKTLHLSWLMAQIFYYSLSTAILTAEGKVSNEAATMISAASKDFDNIKRITYKMKGDDVSTANIIWIPYSRKMLWINTIVGVYFIASGFAYITTNATMGFLLILNSLLVFPSFSRRKQRAASKLYTNRIIRLIIAGVIYVLLLNWS